MLRIEQQQGLNSQTVTHGRHNVTITAHPDRLRLDLIAAARNRPSIELDQASQMAEKLTVYLDPSRYRQHVQAEMQTALPSASLPQRLRRLVQQHRLGPKKDLLGLAYIRPPTAVVFLNTKGLIHKAVPALNIAPKKATARVRQQVCETWMHERSHLLSRLDPEATEERERGDRWKERTRLATNALLNLGGTWAASRGFVAPPSLPALISITLGSTIAARVVNDELWNWLHPKERSARKASRTEESLPGLFDVRVEPQTGLDPLGLDYY